MDGSTAIFDFEKMLENERAKYNRMKEKEIMERIDFLEKNKIEQNAHYFLETRFWGLFLLLSLMLTTLSVSLIVVFLTKLLFHSFGATVFSSFLGVLLGAWLSILLFEKVKVKAKDKYEVKKLKKLRKNMNSKPDFFDESFLSSTASPELIVAFEKEMGRQYLIEMYVANNGEELTNQMLMDHFNKRDRIAQEENNLRILYEDCIKKVEGKHLFCAK